MLDLKEEIAKTIAKATEIKQEELKSYIEMPKDTKNGDYAFPCFRLAKELKKAPPVIASEIKEKIEIRSLKKGECMMFIDQSHILVKINCSDEEKNLIWGEIK